MSRASMYSSELGQARSSAPMIDKYSIVPLLACAYATIITPLILAAFSTTVQEALESHTENKFFWPAVTAISFALFARNYHRVVLPPHIICLFAYLAFAGASVLWAVNPELSFIRYAQQVMVVTSIVLPLMLAGRKSDMMRCLFLCFTVGAVVNLFFLTSKPPYSGYFVGKNTLGQFAGIAFLLAFHEMLYS